MFSYFKKLMQVRRGQKFGNEIADYLNIHRSLFHGAMEEGGCEMHLIKLFNLKAEGYSVHEIALDACDFLLPGLDVLELRFGKQEQIKQAKDAVFNFKKISQSKV